MAKSTFLIYSTEEPSLLIRKASTVRSRNIDKLRQNFEEIEAENNPETREMGEELPIGRPIVVYDESSSSSSSGKVSKSVDDMQHWKIGKK